MMFRPIIKKYGFLLILSIFLSSCTKDSGPIYVPPAISDTISFSDHIQVILHYKCWFCHPTSGDLDLGIDSAYGQLVNRESFGYAPAMRVVPFDTAASVLFHKIKGDSEYGIVMPPGGGNLTLTDEEKEQFTKWILQGALNN